MPSIDFIFLLGNCNRVVEHPDFLIVSSSHNETSGWIAADSIDVRVVDVLMDLLNREAELTGPGCPGDVSDRRGVYPAL